MRKVIIFAVFGLLFAACSVPEPIETILEVTREVEVTREIEVLSQIEVTREVEVTRQVEVIKEIEVTRLVEREVKELGPWVIKDEITERGQYLVPEEIEPGQWAYTANKADETCAASTYSDLSGTYDSLIDTFTSKNKGFFVIDENVRMVAIRLGDCTWVRIGD